MHTAIHPFDEAAWEAQCETISTRAMRNCGLSYPLYQQRLSFEIDVLLADMPAEHHARAIEIVRDFDYLTPDELAVMQKELAAMGCCTHGIDRDCCPLGCGELNANGEIGDLHEDETP